MDNNSSLTLQNVGGGITLGSNITKSTSFDVEVNKLLDTFSVHVDDYQVDIVLTFEFINGQTFGEWVEWGNKRAENEGIPFIPIEEDPSVAIYTIDASDDYVLIECRGSSIGMRTQDNYIIFDYPNERPRDYTKIEAYHQYTGQTD